MPIFIDKCLKLNFKELLIANSEGLIVWKTPHVGNFYTNNLVCGVLGAPILLYEKTIGIKDNYFYPHLLISQGQTHEIANKKLLTTHSQLTRDITLKHIQGKRGDSVVAFHRDSLLQTGYKIELHQAFINSYIDPICRLISVLWPIVKMLDWRYVYSNGLISHIKPTRTEDAQVLYDRSNQAEGWLLPNILNILIHLTIEKAERKSEKVYLLSGPDMSKYIYNYQPLLSELYDMYVSYDHSFDTTSTLSLPTVTNVRFAVPKKHKPMLDSLIGFYQDIQEINCNYTPDSIRKQSIRKSIEKIIADNFSVLSRCIFYDLNKALHLTQYDLLLERDDLYVHAVCEEENIEFLDSMYNYLSKIYRKISASYVNAI